MGDEIGMWYGKWSLTLVCVTIFTAQTNTLRNALLPIYSTIRQYAPIASCRPRLTPHDHV